MDINDLREEFKSLRVSRGYSQHEVATGLLGITQATLSAWETGKNQSMRSETINKIFHLVGKWSNDSTNPITTTKASDTNIVALPRISPDMPPSASTKSHAEPSVDEDLVVQTRRDIEREIRIYLGRDRLGGRLLESLNWDDLCTFYEEAKKDRMEFRILSSLGR